MRILHSLFCFLFLSQLRLSLSAPWFLLNSGGSKCVTVFVPAEHTITVEYASPDAQAKADDDDGTPAARRKKVGSVMDMYEDKRIQEERRQAAEKDSDLVLLMHQRQRDAEKVVLNASGTNKIKHGITSPTGKVEFLTGQISGEVQICIQAFSATRQLPYRFQMKIRYDYNFKTGKDDPVMPFESVNMEQLDQHMNSITTDLYYHLNAADAIARVMDSAKELEATFHQKSVSLAKAIKYWPIFRMLVIIVAGYLQVSHVVRYMRSRRIY